MKKQYQLLHKLAEKEAIRVAEYELPDNVRSVYEGGAGKQDLILIGIHLPIKEKVKTLAHELAHYYLHDSYNLSDCLERGDT